MRGDYDSLIFKYIQADKSAIDNPLDTNEKMGLFVNMRSPTFGANSLIATHASLYTNSTYRTVNNLSDTANLPEKFIIRFEGAYCGDLPRDPYQTPDICQFDMIIGGTGYYQTQETIQLKYSTSGQHDVWLMADGADGKRRINVVSDFITIESVEATNSLLVFKAALLIGVIAAIIGVVTVYRDHKQARNEEYYRELERSRKPDPEKEQP